MHIILIIRTVNMETDGGLPFLAPPVPIAPVCEKRINKLICLWEKKKKSRPI